MRETLSNSECLKADDGDDDDDVFEIIKIVIVTAVHHSCPDSMDG